MGSQDHLEKSLREIRVLLSKGAPFEKNKEYVVVNKKAIYQALDNFNQVMEEVKEEYELTKQRREQAEREARRTGEYIVKNANMKAEDVYAASVLYTDDALSQIQDIMKEADEAIDETMKKFHEQMKQNLQIVKGNQSELKVQLRDMADTKKYLNLIDDVNKKREREKAKEKEEGFDKHKSFHSEGTSMYAKPEIQINKAYFQQNGIPYEEDEPKKDAKEDAPDISVDLDSEYFKWKNSQEGAPEPKEKKSKFFSFGKK